MSTVDKLGNNAKACFAMVFHCHQPVFNLKEAVETACRKAYMPLLRTLEDFPAIKATFHFSGSTLEWLEMNEPDVIYVLGKLIQRGQIEILSGGYYEPVMAVIPERDRRTQLEANRSIIERLFGINPVGAWIAERVWEPGIADTLKSQGLEFTIVDDYHVMAAGRSPGTRFRPCRVSGKKDDLIVLPSLTRLRYTMPFRDPAETVSRLKNWCPEAEGEHPCFVFADDGEKFGAWPRTYNWVHRRGWLCSFFGLLSDSADWLETATCSEMISSCSAEHVGDIQASSYAEMMEWSGGNFRNFFEKYPESGRMYERMTALSEHICRTEKPKETKELATKELMKAQTGCAYWHGTFEGVYLPHLREGVYRHLIEAGNILDDNDGSGKVSVTAVEKESHPGGSECLFRNRYMDVYLDAYAGGVVREIDDRKRRVNLLNTMARKKEPYHVKARREYASVITKARRAALNGDPVNIHDILRVAENGLSKMLVYDQYPRGAFMTHVAPPGTSLRDIAAGKGSLKSFLKGAYSSEVEGDADFMTATLRKRDKMRFGGREHMDIEVIKKVTLGSSSSIKFTHNLVRRSGNPAGLRQAVEYNIFVRDRGIRDRARYFVSDRLSFKDMYSGAVVEFFLDRDREILLYPVYTVNESEAGLKKTFQGISVLFGGTAFSGGDQSGIAQEMKITLTAG